MNVTRFPCQPYATESIISACMGITACLDLLKSN